MTTFTAETFQNEFLAEGATEVNAIVTVTSSGAGVAAAAPVMGMSEILIIDCSGSMEDGRKMPEARKALEAAISVVKDGTWFAIIAGTGEAVQVYPRHGLVQMNPQERATAKDIAARLRPGGGTAIGAWLTLARQLFQTKPGHINHAVLLTDGKNGEKPPVLAEAIRQATGVFQCDARGVGTDWAVEELRRISTALLGTVDIIADPAGLVADFEAVIGSAMGKTSADVALQVWTPASSVIRFVKQVEPDVADLTGKRTEVSPRAGNYPTGSWGGESRDYHVCVDVKPGAVGDEMLAARVVLVSGTDVLAQSLVKAVWTDDTALSTRMNREVAHYTGQAELAQVIQEGLEARKAGDDATATATAKLGRAAQLAAQGGNEGTAKLLAKVVDIEDAATGTVRLKKSVEAADEMALDTRSTKTVRVGRK